MSRNFLMAGLLAACATPLLAQAAAPTAPLPPVGARGMMSDKVVTRAEVDAKVRTHFARIDSNRDGFITTEEAKALRGAHRAMAGKHHGGEHAQMGAMRDPAAAFDRIDTNRDGMISRDEFAKGREMRIEKRVVIHEGAAGPEQPGAMRMMMRRGGGMMGGGMMLKMADTDKDGRVSLAEATSGALRHFDMMDANRDGRLTPEERRAGRATMMQMRKAG